MLGKRVCCRRHWFALPEHLRLQINKASRNDPSVLGALKVEAIQYFESRLIGDHEIVKCRGKDCHADIVWLVTKYGKPIAVDADKVEPDDDQLRYGHHIVHFATCPNADHFRSKARAAS